MFIMPFPAKAFKHEVRFDASRLSHQKQSHFFLIFTFSVYILFIFNKNITIFFIFLLLFYYAYGKIKLRYRIIFNERRFAYQDLLTTLITDKTMRNVLILLNCLLKNIAVRNVMIINAIFII